MSRKNHSKLPIISPIDVPSQQTAAFAGKQYLIPEYPAFQSKRHKMFLDSIKRLLFSNFKWYGITEQEANIIENFLITEGRIGAVKTQFDINNENPDGVFFGRVGSYTENNVELVDFYGNPIGISITGYNGKSFLAPTQNDFVIGFDTCAYVQSNSIIPPIFVYIDNLAKELNDAFEAWKVATETNKLGVVFQANNKRTSDALQEILKRVSSNDPWIVTESDMANLVQVVFKPSQSSALTEFHLNFMNVWGSVLDLLGLEHSQQKKERMIVSEAEMNQNLSRYLAADRLKARKVFCEQINQKFGINIRVENYLASIARETENEANEYGEVEESKK